MASSSVCNGNDDGLSSSSSSQSDVGDVGGPFEAWTEDPSQNARWNEKRHRLETPAVGADSVATEGRCRRKAVRPSTSPTATMKDAVELFPNKVHRTEGEEMRAMLMDLDMHKARTEVVGNAIERSVKGLDVELDSVRSLQDLLAEETRRNRSEAQTILEGQLRPIRRAARPHERLSMHAVKERAYQLRDDLHRARELEGRLMRQRGAETKRLEAHARSKEEANVDGRRAVLRERLAAHERNTSTGNLPMVVGRNVGKTMDPFVAEPTKSRLAVVHASRCEITRAEAEGVLEMQKSSARIDDNIWTANVRRRNESSELERLRTQVSCMQGRIEEEERSRRREDINFAVTRFWQSGGPLSRIHVGVKGEADLEEVDRTTNRVLSAYVKLVRLEQSVGELRVANLLSELIEASKSDAEFWDSGILFGVQSNPHSVQSSQNVSGVVVGPLTTMMHRIRQSSIGGAKCFQRYRREVFIEKVKKEIARLDSPSSTEANEELRVGTDTNGATHQAKSSSRLAASRRSYIERKRLLFRPEIDSARALENCHIELLDNPYQGHLIVKECRVAWKENGTVPVIQHRVHIGDDNWNSVGDEFSLDLRERCYFIVKRGNLLSPVEKSQGNLDLTKKKTLLSIPGFHRAMVPISMRQKAHLVEKERWQMSQMQEAFHDYETTRGVYKICRRHNLTIGDGADINETYLLDFRRDDERRRASFHDVLDIFARMKGLQLQTKALRGEKERISEEYARASDKVSRLYQILMKAKEETQLVEKDFTEARQRVDAEAKARREYEQAVEEEIDSAVEKDATDVALVRAQEAARHAQEREQTLSVEVEAYLRKIVHQDQLIPNLREAAELSRARADESSRALQNAEDDVFLMSMKTKGYAVPSRFGPLKILFVRESDMMACLSFPLGRDGRNPALEGKLFVPAMDCLLRDRSSRRLEESHMFREDTMLRTHRQIEARSIEAELRAFAGEEKMLRDSSRFAQIAAIEEKTTSARQKRARKNARRLLVKRTFQGQLINRIKERTRNDKNLNTRSSSFDSRSSLQRCWDGFSRRRRIFREERNALVEEIAAHEISSLLLSKGSEKIGRVTEKACEIISNDVSKQLVTELCSEVLVEDSALKEESIRKGGLAFNGHSSMSFDVHRELCELWMKRKLRLQGVLKHSTLSVDKARRPCDIVEEVKIYRRERQHMRNEDSVCAGLMVKEVKVATLERNLMEGEEDELRAIYRQEHIKWTAHALIDTIISARIQVEVRRKRRHTLVEAAVAEFRNIQVCHGHFHKVAARMYVRALLHESHIQTGESALMCAHEENSFEQVRANLEQYQFLCKHTATQFVANVVSNGLRVVAGDIYPRTASSNATKPISSEDVESTAHIFVSHVLLKAFMATGEKRSILHQEDKLQGAPLGDCSKEKERRDKSFSSKVLKQSSSEEQSARVAAHVFVRNVLSEVCMAMEEMRSVIIQQGGPHGVCPNPCTLRRAMLSYAYRELAWMEREEEARNCSWELQRQEAEIKRLTALSHKACGEELKARALCRKKKGLLNFCQEADIKAAERSQHCQNTAERTKEVLEFAEEKVKWMDTAVLTKVHQRWPTPELNKVLHQTYFQKLANEIVCRAEYVAVQKKCKILHDELVTTQTDIDKKRCQYGNLKKKLRRRDLLMLRRSALGNRMFWREQRRVLAWALKGWIEFHAWHRNHRQAFELRVARLRLQQKTIRGSEWKENINAVY